MPDITEQVGFFNARIDQMIYRMGFDLSSRTGTVVINTSLIDIRRVRSACPLIQKVFARGPAMGRLMTLFMPGEKAGELSPPWSTTRDCSPTRSSNPEFETLYLEAS